MSTCDTDRITWIISVFLSNMFARTHQMLCICLRGTRLCFRSQGPTAPQSDQYTALSCLSYPSMSRRNGLNAAGGTKKWSVEEGDWSQSSFRGADISGSLKTFHHRLYPTAWCFFYCLFYVFAYMGCQPSHWRTHIFQRGRSTTRQSSLEYPLVIGQINGIIIGNMRIFTGRLWRC